jgi:hypothetical protein
MSSSAKTEVVTLGDYIPGYPLIIPANAGDIIDKVCFRISPSNISKNSKIQFVFISESNREPRGIIEAPSNNEVVSCKIGYRLPIDGVKLEVELTNRCVVELLDVKLVIKKKQNPTDSHTHEIIEEIEILKTTIVNLTKIVSDLVIEVKELKQRSVIPPSTKLNSQSSNETNKLLHRIEAR